MSTGPDDQFSRDPLHRPTNRDPQGQYSRDPMGRRDDELDDRRDWDDRDDPGRPDRDRGNLGSLAQSARLKELNAARWIMILFGILIIVFAVVGIFQVRSEIQKQRQMGNIFLDEQAIMRVVTLIAGAEIGLGIVFILLGAFVRSFPVPFTILGLTLFIIYQIVLIIVDPKNIGRGVIVKVIVVVGMVKAIQAAFAYQNEVRRESEEPGYE